METEVSEAAVEGAVDHHPTTTEDRLRSVLIRSRHNLLLTPEAVEVGVVAVVAAAEAEDPTTILMIPEIPMTSIVTRK